MHVTTVALVIQESTEELTYTNQKRPYLNLFYCHYLHIDMESLHTILYLDAVYLSTCYLQHTGLVVSQSVAQSEVNVIQVLFYVRPIQNEAALCYPHTHSASAV